ncbi:hypothetical protein, partial [Acinetobacter johnsonii]|uniref:hypothetical protein n=1 Tax=Acinetobacter johnsonii TaxID=40214 RepID=UPI00244C11AC
SNTSSVLEAGLNILNNSALRASFVSVYLVGMGCILDHYEIFASAFNWLFYRVLYFYALKRFKNIQPRT